MYIYIYIYIKKRKEKLIDGMSFRLCLSQHMCKYSPLIFVYYIVIF